MYRFPEHWTKLLLALVMIMLTSATVADVLAAAEGRENHQAHAETSHGITIEHHHHDRPSDSNVSDSGEETHQHCHTSHCHGSHMPLAVPFFELNLPAPTQQIPAYMSAALPGHIDTIHRPPIV